MLARYPLHDRLGKDELSIGLIINFAAPPMVEIASLMGFDFVLIDAEHGPIGPAEAEPMIRTAEIARIAPLVRVASDAPDVALRFLDLGATGIVFPHIDSAERARRAVEAVRFPPLGKRSVAPSTNASGFGVRMRFKDYLAHANNLLLVLPILEDPKAVEAADDILAVEGISAAVVGPTDLAAAMGYEGDSTAEPVEAAVDHVLERATARNVPVVLPGGNAEQARRAVERGARLLFAPVGSWLANYGRTYTDAIRAYEIR